MTRKRYIKLMMARGVQKNSAVKLANEVRQCGSYDKLWRRSEWGIISARKAFTKLSKAIASATDIFSAFANAYKCFADKGDESNDFD